ncbi:hypothetical protein [Actinophytocola xanthii]|uniref:Uncharacterized protein n=1 Tax=Actinophytocola xanthii TaxID=1912961 RepID=A0A1Q8C3H9_9PSEU|nr:hypothetical protein [Actinophytocola xanthii]OLF08909.1 hypothetical protein BU204_33835 [Actinophytocola xanthii]
MRIRTDDEVYRVDAVWLGPPRATMPWRARYVAWGVGVVVFLLVLTVERRIGISLFWAIAWGLVVTIIITRLITSRISHERPLSAVAAMWVRELTAPREVCTGTGGAVSATRVRVHSERPRPQARRRDRGPDDGGRAGRRGSKREQGRQPDRQDARQNGKRQHGRRHSGSRGRSTPRQAGNRRG